MEKIDLYKELELSRSSSTDEIKQAYKKLALKWHPDKNKGNEEVATLKFQKISEAYAVLSDPDKRERYDKYGTINEEDFDFQDFMSHFDFQDLFGSLFGDLGFTMNFADFGKAKQRGRAKNKYASKAQVRREQKEAQKLLKEFTKMGFGEDDDLPSKKKDKKETEQKENKSEDEWDTEEEYTDEEDESKPKKENKKAKEEEDDDDYEDVDSDDEKDAKGGFGGFGGFGGIGGLNPEEVFMFPIFMDANTVEVGKKLKCKFDNKVFKNDDDLFDHFDSAHKKEFRAWAKKQ